MPASVLASLALVVVEAVEKSNSVDVVTSGAAGGTFAGALLAGDGAADAIRAAARDRGVDADRSDESEQQRHRVRLSPPPARAVRPPPALRRPAARGRSRRGSRRGPRTARRRPHRRR